MSLAGDDLISVFFLKFGAVWLSYRIVDGKEVGYYCFDPISSGEATSHYIYLVTLYNCLKERDDEFPTNEVTPSYCGLYSDTVSIR